uniref:Uncharacterized protein n=1 Tax=viral metagenome TaxID=1070528 RepID=A0A6H1ZL42_9ZZZZ
MNLKKKTIQELRKLRGEINGELSTRSMRGSLTDAEYRAEMGRRRMIGWKEAQKRKLGVAFKDNISV